MRVLLQRVGRAEVLVDGAATGSIGRGILLFAGIRVSDTETELRWMAKKCAQLRIFEDDDGKMNRAVKDIGGEALVVSQFTLYGDTKKGNRPSFIDAAPPDVAEKMYEQFCGLVAEELGKPVATGKFAAHMKVELINDGPVTIWIEREAS